MSVFLLDTSVVSILFKKHHPLNPTCESLLRGHQLTLSFMSLAELSVWPKLNRWGPARESFLKQHIQLYTTLFPDERTCEIWSSIVVNCRRLGRPIGAADAWIAAVATQWKIPLVTTDYKDYNAVHGMQVIPIE